MHDYDHKKKERKKKLTYGSHVIYIIKIQIIKYKFHCPWGILILKQF